MLIYALFLALGTLAIIAAVISWLKFVSNKKGLRILMYHKLDQDKSDFLTVKVSDFASHIHYLVENGYRFLTFKQLIESERKLIPLPEKSIILTFDDGYQNNHDHLLPILKQHQISASVFLPVNYIGKQNEWDGGSDQLMDWETLKQSSPYFEYGYHSFHHRDMAKMAAHEFREDLENGLTLLKSKEIETVPVLAFPYGKYPKSRDKRAVFEEIMKEYGLRYALRIGNKINPIPFPNRYLLCRLDIRGTDSLDTFCLKVKRGKLKLF